MSFFIFSSSLFYFLLHLILQQNDIELAEFIKKEIPCTLFILIL